MTRVAGVDEAGRGPLAGPVVAAAVILNFGSKAVKPPFPLVDSKTIDEKKRELLYDWLYKSGAEIGVGQVEHDEIDTINIHNASLLAMKKAVMAIRPLPERLVVDGRFTIDMAITQKAIIKGDSKVESISAASIVAKVTRDRIMKRYHEDFPEYGFSSHKGYPTKSHKKAVLEFGPTPVHRLTFRGVRGV